MKEVTGNLWDYHARGEWIVITTNGDVNKLGHAVMGRGIAKEASIRFPLLAFDLGNCIEVYGNIVYPFSFCRLFTFPVKHHWQEAADLKLIKRSAAELNASASGRQIPRVFLPRPGCGNGRLTWDVVKPVIEGILDDRFTIVEKNP